MRLQFGHSTPKYQLPAAGVMGASLNKPCQDIGRPPPCAATLTIDSKASTFFSPCVDIVGFLVFGGSRKFGDGRGPLNLQHSLIASPPRDHAAISHKWGRLFFLALILLAPPADGAARSAPLTKNAVSAVHRHQGVQCGFFGMPRGLGLATATTSAAFFPHLEQRIRSASSRSVIFQPTRRASASGSISRRAPQSQITLTRDCPKQSSSFWM